MDPQTTNGSASPGRVGYVLKMFPRLSETFILNELLELERQGVELSVYSLSYPADGRFHGRLAELSVAAEYFPRERPEHWWAVASKLPAEMVPPLARWGEAVDFLRRHAIPADLELLLRAVVVAARARQQGVRHLHAHFATVATRVAALVHLLTGIPFSFTAHAKDIFRETVDWRLFGELAERAAFCVTVSDFNRLHILSRAPQLAPDKVVRLYNGIDLRFFEAARNAAPDDVPHIVSVGRLVPKKGFDHLLHALSACKAGGLGFRCTIVGDGEERERLYGLRDALGLADEVLFAGALTQEQVRDLCTGATMMVLACVADTDGNKDALPTTLLEALALDLPIVSTRLTGVPEIVGQGTGVLVEPGDAGALAGAIRGVWDEIRERRWPRGLGRVRAERLFDLGRNVAALRARFTGAAAQGRGR